MRKSKPKQVIDAIYEHMTSGFNKSQATSLAWSEFFEERAAQIEYKYQGNFSVNYTFDCYCLDCKQGGQFKAADTVRLFIIEHKDHKTKTMKL